VHELPVGGFQAAVRARLPTASSGRWGARERGTWLRGLLGATRAEAEAGALDAVYEALMKPLWKTTAALTGLRGPPWLPAELVTQEDAARHVQWRAERLEPLGQRTGAGLRAASGSLGLWFGGVCLCCLAAVAHGSWRLHAAGDRHRRNFAAVPVQLKPSLQRPPTAPGVSLYREDSFLQVAGWALGRAPILSVGEMDFSFSLAVARLRPPRSKLVATSYLRAHDSTEHEHYPEDDAERASFERRSLPGMGGELEENLKELRKLGSEVRHGVDATNLVSTLQGARYAGPFGCVVFPFPRATLRRENDPKNSELVRAFFRNAAPGAGLVAPGGVVQLLILGSQYEDWDIAGCAADAGLVLWSRAVVPSTFYQTREVSGRAWDFGQSGELLCFRAASEGEPKSGRNQDRAAARAATFVEPERSSSSSWKRRRPRQEVKRTLDTFRPVPAAQR